MHRKTVGFQKTEAVAGNNWNENDATKKVPKKGDLNWWHIGRYFADEHMHACDKYRGQNHQRDRASVRRQLFQRVLPGPRRQLRHFQMVENWVRSSSHIGYWLEFEGLYFR